MRQTASPQRVTASQRMKSTATPAGKNPSELCLLNPVFNRHFFVTELLNFVIVFSNTYGHPLKNGHTLRNVPQIKMLRLKLVITKCGYCIQTVTSNLGIYVSFLLISSANRTITSPRFF